MRDFNDIETIPLQTQSFPLIFFKQKIGFEVLCLKISKFKIWLFL